MRFPHVVLLSACALMWTATLFAQSPNGVINGLVVDASNRAIVGADVVVVNDVTGVQYTTKTNEEGIYVLPNLPPGPYRLQVSKVGIQDDHQARHRLSMFKTHCRSTSRCPLVRSTRQ